MPAKKVLVTGAGGFIGHHLVKFLHERGYWIRGVDIKHPAFESSPAHAFELLDLRRYDNCLLATRGIEEVYHVAGHSEPRGLSATSQARVTRNQTMINVHVLEAARQNGIRRFFYSSSNPPYPTCSHEESRASARPDAEARLARPEERCSLVDLHMEKLCQYYRDDYGLQTRVVRFRNVYGPLDAYEDSQRTPASVCRQVACLPGDGGEVEVCGDGSHVSSFVYIQDYLEGIYRLMRSDYPHPLCLGSDEVVTMNQLIDITARIAGKPVRKRYDLTRRPATCAGYLDSSQLRKTLQWEPRVSLRQGLATTYAWVAEQVRGPSRSRVEPAPDSALLP